MEPCSHHTVQEGDAFCLLEINVLWCEKCKSIPMSQEGQKDHQGQQPPEPLPVHPAIIQKSRSVQVHQSGDVRLKNSFYLKVIRLLNSHH